MPHITRPQYTEMWNRLQEVKTRVEYLKTDYESFKRSVEPVSIALHEIFQIEKILAEIDNRNTPGGK